MTLRRLLLLSAAGAVPLYAVAQTREPTPAARHALQPGGGTAPMPGYAPTGDQISQERLPLYHRGTPYVALCGPIQEAGVREAKRVGFTAILDLQADPGRAAAERRNAEFARIRYFHLPIRTDMPTEEEVRRFAELLADRGNLPVLVHGSGVEQSGAMWALYRAALGVPPEIALLDGETAGLRAGLPAARARLGLPPAAG
jgi:uncharacterized protein (TIGR01244 family)